MAASGKYHECKKCHYKTTLVSRMKSHMKTHKSFNCAKPIGKFKCFRCAEFETYELVHVAQHCKAGHTLVTAEEKLYKCKSCSFFTHSEFILLKHEMSNLCPITDKKSQAKIPKGKTKDSGDTVELSKRDSETKSSEKKQLLKCELCQYTTEVMANLKTHILRKHCYLEKRQSNCRFKCDHCPFETRFSYSLTRHLLNKHTDPKLINWFDCNHCSYRSKDKSHLKIHMESHADQNKFKCDHCPFQTKYKRGLVSHMRTHAESDTVEHFECEHCDYKTKTKGNLNNHLRYRHKDGGTLNCEKCEFQTKFKHSLQRHVLRKHSVLEKD